MSLYRLDFLQLNGQRGRPVLGTDLGLLPTGDVLTHHAATARKRATEAARKTGHDVQISRISGGGILKPTMVIQPDGQGRRPAHTKPAVAREDCVKAEGKACFCTPCRSERRG